MKHINALTVLLLLIAFPLCAQRQRGDSLIVERITLASKILGEDRKIYIQIPAKKKGQERCPVLYVLDGESHFDLVSQYCGYLGRWDVNVIPEMIVVGIGNTDRARDLTPTRSVFNYFGKESPESWLKTSGGNEKFFQFLQQEVMPYVESHYRTEPFKIFAGHSFGGITVVNNMLIHPEMFNAYIAVSPSFWWDRKYLLKQTNEKLSSKKPLNKTIFFTVGNEGISDGSSFHADVLKFDSLLKVKAVPGLVHKFVDYPNETHMTVPVVSYLEGLRFIFSGWPLPTIDDDKITGEIVSRHYAALSKQYGYTMRPNEKNIRDWASYLSGTETTRDNAISLLETLYELYPSSTETLTALGDAYALAGEKSKARNCYEKVISMDPHSSDVKDKLKKLQ